MKIGKISLSIILAAVLLYASPGFAQFETGQIDRDRRGQTGFKFLSMSLDARAAAMGDAMTSQMGASTAMFYNTAAMGWFDGTFDVSLGQVQWIGDITYNAASLAYNSPIGVFGLSGSMVDYGDVIGTIRSDTQAGYEEIGNIAPSAMVIGLGYARALTNQFAVGANVKIASQDLGSAPVEMTEGGSLTREDYAISAAVFDFGVIYQTGFESLNIAISARNFSQELTFAEESFETPLTFRLGASMNLMDLTSMDPNMHSLMLSVDTERPRDFDEQVKIGGEYLFMNTFAVRAGYVFPTDEQGLSAGFGIVDLAGLNVSYTFTDFGIFGNVNRFSVGYGF
ncbi:MAG: PorV/PorQ family protein [Candidatus Marinimicrobia bacterium]|nr:PorV/PorQ family protein [Candidatus Neomarinimicrobiota bacterium]